ncbi:DUF3955 domain-containing protein [Sulfurovum sp.]|uniref:DUF3955 domain-containing protein n=1 Tax=Sulfurovum sp. TaxID=1969726 RepID=UPI0034576D31
MKKLFQYKGIKTSLLLLVLGLISFFIQNTFYGYIDKNNVLQDSILLPLGFLLFILGLVGLFLSLLWIWYQGKDQ